MPTPRNRLLATALTLALGASACNRTETAALPTQPARPAAGPGTGAGTARPGNQAANGPSINVRTGSMPSSPGGVLGTPLGEVGATSMVIFGIDMARVRVLPSFGRLRQRVMGSYDSTPEHRALVAACGFDPLDRLNRLTVALPPGALGQSVAIIARGNGTSDEFDRCATRYASDVTHHAMAPAPAVGAHPVYVMNTPPGQPPGHASVFSSGVVAASPSVLSQVLSVLDGAQPGAESNPSLSAASAAVGENALVYLYVDLRTLRPLLAPAQRPHFADMPGISAAQQEALFDDSTSVGLAISSVGPGYRVRAMAGFTQLHSAETGRSLLQALLGLANLQFQAGGLDAMRAGVGPNPDARALVDLLGRAVARIELRTEGSEVRGSVELSGPDVDVLERGLTAMIPAGPPDDTAPGLPDLGPAPVIPPHPEHAPASNRSVAPTPARPAARTTH